MKSAGIPDNEPARLAARCRRQKRVAAQRRRKHAAALLAQLDGLWEWDLETGEAFYAPRFAELLGLAARELPAHESAFFSRLHPEDLPRARAAVQPRQTAPGADPMTGTWQDRPSAAHPLPAGAGD